MTSLAHSLYLHIPFCSRKCAYCDFAVRVLQHDQQVTRYFAYLEQELQFLADYLGPLKTLYLGGGTPSLLSVDQIRQLGRILQRHVDLSSLSEWTLEVNPEHAEPEALALWRDLGVNRVSLGVQSFDDALLQRCGRLHQQADIFLAVDNIRRAGFENWSLDLMYALPTQTLAQWQDSLKQAVALAPSHLSLYALEVHPKTLFGAQALPDFSEDLAGDMYDMACAMLGQAGFVHYEIANFCQPGLPSAHNQVYWQTQAFAAVGVGAHGYLQGRRYENPHGLTDYYRMCETRDWALLQTPEQSLAEAIEEFLFLGLRQLLRGVSLQVFEQRFGQPLQNFYPQRLPQALERGFLIPTASGESLRLSPEAVAFSNRIFSEFLDPVMID